MTLASDLYTRFAPELEGFGASLPDDFNAALSALESRLDAAQLERWAQDGVALANASLRSWEASAEYFRASPDVFERLGAEGVQEWVATARRLADSSSLIAAAFLKSTPAVLGNLPASDLPAWAAQGERLCKGNWKSIALSALYFQVTPPLLRNLPLASVGRLVEVIDHLTERSYELANTCLETAPRIFATLAADDREPFLRFARAVARASWADTRLYFDRGPRLLENIATDQRAPFLDLASWVTTEVGRQGFPLYSDAADALGQIAEDDHASLIEFSQRLVEGSPTAAMEHLKTAPFVRTRLNAEQMARWQQYGLDIMLVEKNPEGAEAYFRLESARAEEQLRALSSRVELGSINTMLRLYAKALSGESVAVLSAEELTDARIGWVNESAATTEGSAIYLPPFVATFEDQQANFQVYKVYATHQTARMEFGSFHYRWGRSGVHTGSTIRDREAATKERRTREQSKDFGEAITPIQRYFNCFDDRLLISALFTVAEDTRVDSLVAREYGGIRRWLRRLPGGEGDQRPNVHAMGLRAAFVENLLRNSLGRSDTIMWPVAFREYLQQGIAALRKVEQGGATVQDSAEVAAALYDMAQAIPNIVAPPSDGKFEWEGFSDDMNSSQSDMPSGADGPQMDEGDEEIDFTSPPQPQFRGEFKPELVQLMQRLKNKGDAQDGEMSPLSKEQLKELLENSAEMEFSDFSDDDLDDSLGMWLENMEQAAQNSPGDQDPDSSQGESNDEPGGGEEGGDGDLPVEIDWFYYDEWDFRAGDYKPRWNRVGERYSKEGDSDFYTDTLRRYHGLVMETRKQFEMMRPESFKKIKRLEDGDELDLDLAIEFIMDKRAGTGPQQRIYNRRNKEERDVAVAFLLDMSASTDEEIEKQRVKTVGTAAKDDDSAFDGDPRQYFQWLAARRSKALSEPPKRIIDLEKESAVLIVEALEAIGDDYGIYGFSGYGRENVEFHVIKELGEEIDGRAMRRIGAIEPIRSTRMGPAIRHTIHKLQEHDAKVKILILVSDGRPQDHGYGRDRTEKEYAVHDTKQALNEAKRLGITPFLITVDKEGHDYLKQMCDDIGYEVVDDIESLPRRLPTLYRHLAAD